MMRLCAACRNTSVRRTTGTAPDEMTSASTWPGPTEGSWSISPTIKRAALSGTALMSACISMTSTMEVSSTTSSSQSRGVRDFEELLGKRHELVRGQAAMTFIHRLGQRIGDAGAYSDQGGLIDAELHRDGIRRFEPDATDVARQTIGVLRHNLHGVGAVGLENAHRTRRAHTVAMQEDHDLAHHLLLGPGGDDATSSYRTDAIHLSEAVRLRLDDVEHLLPEGV